jgi:hypothetical protein
LALPQGRRVGQKFFVLGEGRAVVPHAHDNMVSAHIVVEGSFHARTFDRNHDEASHLHLTPSRDERIGLGSVLTMSEHRDNVHWLVAEGGRSCTFDVVVATLEPDREFAWPSNRHGMIFLDPDAGETTSKGLFRVPKIGVEDALARYG